MKKGTADREDREPVMHEKVFRGIMASPGIVIGRAYLLDRRKVVVAGQRIEEVSVKDEVARFKLAVELSKSQLEDLKASPRLGKSYSISSTRILCCSRTRCSLTHGRAHHETRLNAAGRVRDDRGDQPQVDTIEDGTCERKHDGAGLSASAELWATSRRVWPISRVRP
jgi:hypothetical protein